MKKDLLAVLDRRLRNALAVQEGETAAKIRSEWRHFSPDAESPTNGEAWRAIVKICQSESQHRSEVVLFVMKKFCRNHRGTLTPTVNKEIMSLVETHLFRMPFIEVACQTDRAYKVAQGPVTNFDENAAQLHLAQIEAFCRNESQKTVSTIRQNLEGLRLSAPNAFGSTVRRGLRWVTNCFALPVVRWLSVLLIALIIVVVAVIAP